MLNKFGRFNLSRGLVIGLMIWLVTRAALSYEAVELSNLMFIPIAATFTLFDATFLKACIPLVGICIGCYTYIRWENDTSPQRKLSDAAVGVVLFLSVAFCFHRLALENGEYEATLEVTVTGLQAEVSARERVESSLRKASKVKQDFLASISVSVKRSRQGRPEGLRTL